MVQLELQSGTGIICEFGIGQSVLFTGISRVWSGMRLQNRCTILKDGC